VDKNLLFVLSIKYSIQLAIVRQTNIAIRQQINIFLLLTQFKFKS